MSTGAERELGATPQPASAIGFHAQLEGASLWDLVQMECLARSRLVVQVTGEGGVGYLYFDGGHVVHAATARRLGQAAALEILGWTRGTFQASDRSWPSSGPTIDISHESLLLHAAKDRDERGASNLVAFPGRVTIAPEDLEVLEIEEEGEEDMRNPNIDDTPVPPAPPRGESAADFPVMVRLCCMGWSTVESADTKWWCSTKTERAISAIICVSNIMFLSANTFTRIRWICRSWRHFSKLCRL